MSKTEIEFPEGIRVFNPTSKAPDSLRANIVVDIEKFVEWAETKKKNEIRLNIWQSPKNNKLYFSVDNFVPKKKEDNFEF